MDTTANYSTLITINNKTRRTIGNETTIRNETTKTNRDANAEPTLTNTNLYTTMILVTQKQKLTTT